MLQPLLNLPMTSNELSFNQEDVLLTNTPESSSDTLDKQPVTVQHKIARYFFNGELCYDLIEMLYYPDGSFISATPVGSYPMYDLEAVNAYIDSVSAARDSEPIDPIE